MNSNPAEHLCLGISCWSKAQPGFKILLSKVRRNGFSFHIIFAPFIEQIYWPSLLKACFCKGTKFVPLQNVQKIRLKKHCINYLRHPVWEWKGQQEHVVLICTSDQLHCVIPAGQPSMCLWWQITPCLITTNLGLFYQTPQQPGIGHCNMLILILPPTLRCTNCFSSLFYSICASLDSKQFNAQCLNLSHTYNIATIWDVPWLYGKSDIAYQCTNDFHCCPNTKNTWPIRDLLVNQSEDKVRVTGML